MALSGVHIICAKVRLHEGSSLLGNRYWSETLSSAGTTTNLVGDAGSVLQISAGIDAYVAVGPTPDATQAVSNTQNNIRYFIGAGTTMPVFAGQGDKVAYTPA